MMKKDKLLRSEEMHSKTFTLSRSTRISDTTMTIAFSHVAVSAIQRGFGGEEIDGGEKNLWLTKISGMEERRSLSARKNMPLGC